MLPPGSGKTAVGLEIARRRGRRTLVLVPHAAVQAQWLAQWAAFAPPHAPRHPVAAGTAVGEGALTVVPYAELAVRHPPAEQDESAPPAGQGDLLVQLDPAVRDVLERAGRGEPWLLVLDECAPSELRGAVASGVREALGRATEVVGLGSTLPADLPAGRRELAGALLGEVDLHVPLAAAVQDGDVAPYQELLLHCAPTAAEQAWLDGEVERTQALVDALLAGRRGSRPLLDWLSRRLGVRPNLPWTAVERSEPELARAGLRLAAAGALPVPQGSWLREEHRVPLDAADWAVVLEGYAADQLTTSRSPDDAALLEEVLTALPSLGRDLSGRHTVPPVDRLCAVSPAKVAAAERVLVAEAAVLGDDLRALVLCAAEDEPAHVLASLRGARADGSALLALELLAAGEAAALRPVLVTQRRVAAPPDVAQELRRSSGVPGLRSVPLSGTALYELASDRPDWGPRVWTPLVTAFLEQGGTRLLVGTTALLGEGWDCPSLSVVVDLGSGPPAAAARAAGRALRIDPSRPGKAADLWTVVCVADGHPAGTADHLRAVARHAAVLAPSPTGEVLAGIGHCDAALREGAAVPRAERAAVDERALQRAGRRDRARDAWQVGAAPHGQEAVSLVVRTARDPGLAGRVVPWSTLRPRGVLTGAGEPVPPADAPAAAPPGSRDPAPARLWPAPLLAAALAGGAGAAVDPLVGLGTGAAAAGAAGALLGGLRARRQSRALRGEQDRPGRALEQLAAAVADALHAVGDVPRGADALVLQPHPDGGTRCRLDVPVGGSAAYADALEELLTPVAEPRWLVARAVVARPADERAARRLSLARAVGRPVDALLTWHAVPAACGAVPARVEAFAAAWEEHVGPARLVRCREPEGRALLDLLRGADPFGTSVHRLHAWGPAPTT